MSDHSADTSKFIFDQLMRFIDPDLFGTPPNNDSNLTLDVVKEMRQNLMALRPVIWYATSDVIERGTVFQMHATEYYDEYWILHPDDLPEKQKQWPGIWFRHICDRPHNQTQGNRNV